MSEKAPNIEIGHAERQPVAAERVEHAPVHKRSHHEQAAAIKQAEAAVASESARTEKPQLPPVIDDRPLLIDHSAKLLRMRQSLAKVQTKLSPNQRSFSRVIHQPLVQKVSESASQTVARPSGMLGGGIAAFIGCLGYQILVRYYGLPYNFSLFLIFFAIGFICGLVGEYIVRHNRSRS